MMQKAIGGYFELELHNRGSFPHDDGVLLNSGRNALEYVLRSLKDIRRLWIPYYICDVVLEPLVNLNIEYLFYHIDSRLELQRNIVLRGGDYILYPNYFGVKDEYVVTLVKQYDSKLIVDNAQAWFMDPIEGVSTIYSPRKYVGVPDGGIAYCSNGIDVNQFDQDSSFDRCLHLLKRLDIGAVDGYDDFKENSHKLCNQPIRQMSNLTKALLSSIDFEEIKGKRIENFMQLHNVLQNSNKFEIPRLSSFHCPMAYPYLTDDISLKKKLIEHKVFVATYWPKVKEWTTEEMLENKLLYSMVPIPCDQRCDNKTMEIICALI